MIVDFTTAAASLSHAALAAGAGVPIVIGTTGHDESQATQLKAAAAKTTVVWCANTSVGVTLLTRIVEDAVRALGGGWDIEKYLKRITGIRSMPRRGQPSPLVRPLPGDARWRFMMWPHGPATGSPENAQMMPLALLSCAAVMLSVNTV